MTRSLVFSLALTSLFACHSAQSDEVPSPKQPSSAPAALFQPLLTEGHTMRFTVTSTHAYWDDSDPRANANGMVESVSTNEDTCVVQGVHTMDDAHISHLECEGGMETLGQTFVITANGLWLTHDDAPNARAVARLTATAPDMPARPREGLTHEEGGDEGHGSETSITHSNTGAWCLSTNAWGGDEFWEALCFHPTHGITSANRGWAGGSTQDVLYDLIEPTASATESP